MRRPSASKRRSTAFPRYIQEKTSAKRPVRASLRLRSPPSMAMAMSAMVAKEAEAQESLR